MGLFLMRMGGGVMASDMEGNCKGEDVGMERLARPWNGVRRWQWLSGWTASVYVGQLTT